MAYKSYSLPGFIGLPHGRKFTVRIMIGGMIKNAQMKIHYDL